MAMANSSTILLASSFLLLLALPSAHATVPGPWKKAHATFYEGGSTSYGGACGYEDVVKAGYSLDTAALSPVLFKQGQTCGACYEVRCVESPQWCKPGQPTIQVTATNLCPSGEWCSPPHEHFDLAKSAFLKIAEYKGGIVPIQYRRVPCKRQGGIRFSITGNPYFNMVSVWNVGGAGDIQSVEVKSESSPEWRLLKRNWGQKWEISSKLVGESLSFRFKTSDGNFLTSPSVCPKTWKFGQTFEAQNFA
ncbi:expansin-A9-like [Senna tora]|uniref:Expansin n=1 Tax=Senna tora TaxID=362788 RepID=A0A834W505_9FABA|nr:expansin-A9-like [Senna tora]